MIQRILLIHQAQIEAEGDDAHIGLLKNRWKRVMDHLAVCKLAITTDRSIIYSKLEECYKKQVNDIHYLAHWLNPSNIKIDRFYEYEQATVLAALESLIEPHQYPHTMETFLSYYNRIGPFRDIDHRWDYKDRPVIYLLALAHQTRPSLMPSSGWAVTKHVLTGSTSAQALLTLHRHSSVLTSSAHPRAQALLRLLTLASPVLSPGFGPLP
jgi:hypothetical protein